METKDQVKYDKNKVSIVSTTPIRVKRDTRRLIEKELAKANKKECGRKIKADDLLRLALSLLGQEHIKSLQEASLSNADRLDVEYREYIKKHGTVTKDAFLGILLLKRQEGEAQADQGV